MPSALLREQSLHVERPLPWALCAKEFEAWQVSHFVAKGPALFWFSVDAVAPDGAIFPGAFHPGIAKQKKQKGKGPSNWIYTVPCSSSGVGSISEQ